MQNWRILNEQDLTEKLEASENTTNTYNKVGKFSNTSKAKSVAVIGSVVMTGFSSPIIEFPISYSDNTIVANYSQGKDFEMENKMVSKDSFNIYKELLDEKFKGTNEKLDKISNTLDRFITEESITKTNLMRTFFSNIFAKVGSVIVVVGGFLGILKSLGLLEFLVKTKP